MAARAAVSVRALAMPADAVTSEMDVTLARNWSRPGSVSRPSEMALRFELRLLSLRLGNI
jgi:hypothetical protein